jgi:hypothetical protein
MTNYSSSNNIALTLSGLSFLTVIIAVIVLTKKMSPSSRTELTTLATSDVFDLNTDSKMRVVDNSTYGKTVGVIKSDNGTFVSLNGLFYIKYLMDAVINNSAEASNRASKSAPILTLKEGYRPKAELRFSCAIMGIDGSITVIVGTDGTVTILPASFVKPAGRSGADTQYVSLDNVSFFV